MLNVKTVQFQTMSFNIRTRFKRKQLYFKQFSLVKIKFTSILPTDWTLSGANTTCLSVSGSDGNKEIKVSRITARGKKKKIIGQKEKANLVRPLEKNQRIRSQLVKRKLKTFRESCNATITKVLNTSAQHNTPYSPYLEPHHQIV